MTKLVELTDVDVADLMEIQRLHDEAFQHYRTNDTWGGGHKSSEGYVSVNFGNFFDRDDDRGTYKAGVEVYSYVFGPHRNHYFDTIKAGLEAVRVWHKAEMERDYAAEANMWEDATFVIGPDDGEDSF